MLPDRQGCLPQNRQAIILLQGTSVGEAGIVVHHSFERLFALVSILPSSDRHAQAGVVPPRSMETRPRPSQCASKRLGPPTETRREW